MCSCLKENGAMNCCNTRTRIYLTVQGGVLCITPIIMSGRLLFLKSSKNKHGPLFVCVFSMGFLEDFFVLACDNGNDTTNCICYDFFNL